MLGVNATAVVDALSVDVAHQVLLSAAAKDTPAASFVALVPVVLTSLSKCACACACGACNLLLIRRTRHAAMNGTAAEPIVRFMSYASQMLTPELMQGLAKGTFRVATRSLHATAPARQD